MPLGKCRHCNYEPVALDARACPKCGGRRPADDWAPRWIARCILGGMFGGGVLAACNGAVATMTIGGVLAGFVVGATGGLLVGLVVGVAVATIA